MQCHACTGHGLPPSRGSVSAASPSPRSAYRYFNGRLATAVALSVMPDIALRQSRPLQRSGQEHASGKCWGESGSRTPRRRFGRGWAVLTRPAIYRKKATQDLGTTPTQAKAARMRPAGGEGASSAGRGSKLCQCASGRRTKCPLLCDVCQFPPWTFFFFAMDVADDCRSPTLPPRVL